MATYSVAIAGASGYAGGEAARLLSQHPNFDIATLCAHTQAGSRVIDTLPHLRGVGPETFAETTIDTLAGHDVVILGLPHGESASIAKALEEKNPNTVIADLGADFRLDDPAAWQQFYGSDHAGCWTYGLPELPLADGTRQRELLAHTTRIAVPGCNATAVTFAATPLVRAGIIDPSTLGAVLSVGYSGAGKSAKPNLLLAEGIGGAAPYSAGGMHRHIPEIIQNISRATGVARNEFALSFTPVLVPMSRGIMAVLTAKLKPGVGKEGVGTAFTESWGGERFVQLYGEGGFPSTASAAGANTVHIGWVTDLASGTVTVMCAIDNLVKGTAGAAIQSLNIAFGLPEEAGLPIVGLHP